MKYIDKLILKRLKRKIFEKSILKILEDIVMYLVNESNVNQGKTFHNPITLHAILTEIYGIPKRE